MQEARPNRAPFQARVSNYR